MSEIHRLEVIGTWDVTADDTEEAIEKLASKLPDDAEISQSDVSIKPVEN